LRRVSFHRIERSPRDEASLDDLVQAAEYTDSPRQFCAPV
jgi:hypothetical protein